MKILMLMETHQLNILWEVHIEDFYKLYRYFSGDGDRLSKYSI